VSKKADLKELEKIQSLLARRSSESDISSS